MKSRGISDAESGRLIEQVYLEVRRLMRRFNGYEDRAMPNAACDDAFREESGV